MAISETISIDAGPAVAELDALAGAAEAAAAKIDAAFKSIKVPSLGGSGAANMARSMDAAATKMSAAVDKMEASFAKLKAAGAEAGAAMGDIGKAGAESAAGLGDAAKAANDAALSYGRLGKASRDSAVLMDEQAVASRRAAKSSAEGAAASEGFFSRHKELILGTGLALGYAVDKAMKFNASMTLLQTQAGVSAQQMPQLTKGVIELAGQVGQSPGNLAESLYHVESNMSSLGIKAPQALHMVKVAAEGASVGHANLVDTTNALTAAVASGIPGVKSYDQAMGVLNATVGAGDMSMQDLADAMGTGALAVIKGYGANIKDAGAALAVFGDNNIRGAAAGTELRMAVQALAVPAASAKKELKDLGLTTGTLGKTMQDHGMLAALEQLDTKLKAHGITAKNEGQVLTDLFGKKAGTGLAILMEQLGRLQSKYPELTRGANQFGNAWDKALQTPQQRLHNLEQGTQALAITAGNVLMPYVNKALGGLDTGLQWLQQHSFASKGLALGAGALVAGGIGKGLFSGVESSLQGLGKIGSLLKIPGADKLANLGQSSGLTASASALDGAAASLEGAAASLKGSAVVSGEAGVAGAAGKETAAAEAAAGSKIGAGIGKGIGAAVTVAIGLAISKGIIDHLQNPKDHRVLGNTNPNSPWNNWESKRSLGGMAVRFLARENTPAYGPLQGRGGGGPPPVFIVPHPAPAPSAAVPMLGVGGHQFTIKPKISPPDTGAISSALAGLANSVHLKPVKMPAPDMSALDGAKGKAQAAATGITQAMESALHKVVKANAPDLSAYGSAAGKARADGANISAGLASGILSGEGAVVAAAQAVAAAASAAMASALKTHSPSKVTEKTGKDFDAGFVVGLQGGKDAVDAAAAAIGKTAAKAADIASIDSYTAKLLKQVPHGDTALTAMLKADNKALDNMARTRARLEQEISDSETVAKNMVSGASITNALNAVNPAGNEPVASAAIVTGQGYQAQSLKEFAAALQKDKALGLNATSLSQIAQAGPDQGLGIAQGIASGGKDAVKQLNTIQRQIQASSAAIGDVAGPAMYQAGQDVAKGLASGLRSELSSLDKAMETLAKSMVHAVQSNVKKAKDAAHKAGAGTAKDTAAGAASGVTAASGGSASAVAAAGKDKLGAAAASLSAAGASLSSAASALSSAAANLSKSAGGGGAGGAGGHGGGSHPGPGGGTGRIAPGAPAYGGGHGGGSSIGYLPSFGGGGQHVHYHQSVTVQGSVMTERDLLNTLQEAQLTRQSSNWQSGWNLPGRGA